MPGILEVKSVFNFSLLNIRLCFHSLALLHSLIAAYLTWFTIDVSKVEDPKIRAYSRVRWCFLTNWYNFLILCYIPLCIYCDLRQKFGKETLQVDKLRHFRDVIMTAILFPVTTFGDAGFWIIFEWAPWIIASSRAFEYMPYWAQHSFHTVSFAFVIIDLVLTPRTKPKSHRTNVTALLAFAFLYGLAMSVSCLRGDYMYSYLKAASRLLCISMFLGALLINITLYYLQWYLIDYVWRSKDCKKTEECSKLK